MVSTPTEGNWPVTFPGNLRWSNATQIVKGMVAYGAAAMAEIDLIVQRLKARAGDADLDRAWMEEWSKEADRVAKIGDEADAAGNAITAGNQYMRAGNYYYSAERFIPPGEEKLAIYRKALRCYQGAMARLHPDIERVEVPYEGQSLPAWFVKGRGLGKRPTVVLFDGMDNAKEMSVIFAGLDFAKRGINMLAIDGPGQSEPLRLHNIPTRHDYEAAGIPAYDYVASRPDVDPKRVAVMGYSFGGYHAPRICAFDKRYAACVCFGAMHWNIYDFVVGHAPDRSAADLGLDLPVPLGGRRARQRNRAGMGEEIHARRRGRQGRMPDPDPARRERPRRAARRSEKALRARRLQEQDAENLHRGRRRRRALPGRQPPARRRLHRRLADEDHVSFANKIGRENT